MLRSDVTGVPPIESPVLRMVDRMEFKMLPYVAPWPCSTAWMKQKVIAPVDVIFERACAFDIVEIFIPLSV